MQLQTEVGISTYKQPGCKKGAALFKMANGQREKL